MTKIVFGHIITSSDFFEFQVEQHTWPSLQIFKRRRSNATRSVFFSEGVINVWNSLPCDITNFSSVNAFKRFLRAIDLSGFCTALFSIT